MQRAVIEAATLVDAGQLQFLNRVGDLLKALLGQMQITGGHFQILVTEQNLDGAQVGPRFK
jgi:hypothetical protein